MDVEMSEHKATIRWAFPGGDFLKGRYSREHTWSFDGGVTVPASSSPAAVPKPYSNEANVDPEEAFVASLSSCHMLTYLFLASRAGFEILSYEDEAVGTMTKNERGVAWVSAVVLRPRLVYGGDKRPSIADEDKLHHAAHDQCFIANSVKTEVVCEPEL
jgi:organic hydroperoxide reductase OsmC/OhrA